MAKRILLIKIERIGDLVLSTPGIRAVKEKFPYSEISIVVNSYTKPIIEKFPYIDEIFEYNKKMRLAEKIKVIRMLRLRDFYLAIDLTTRDFFFTPVWLSFFSKAKLRIGLDNFGRGFLYNIKVAPYRYPCYYPQEIIHILCPLGIVVSNLQPQIFVSDRDRDWIREYLSSKITSSPDIIVVIHPGGYYKQQWWRKEGYARLGRCLAEEYNAVIFFVGDHRERVLIDEIINLISSKESKNKRLINTAGRLTLGQLMALISKSCLFIGNSSGPLHIAVGLKIPTVSFLSPNVSERWRPQGENNLCFSLYNSNVDEVISAVKAQLTKIQFNEERN